MVLCLIHICILIITHEEDLSQLTGTSNSKGIKWKITRKCKNKLIENDYA